MSKSQILSPAQSHNSSTRRKQQKPKSRSVGSPASNATSVKLSELIRTQSELAKGDDKSFILSPMRSRMSVLSDNTYIEAPKRKSWWRRLEDDTEEVMKELQNKKVTSEPVEDELPFKVLGPEKHASDTEDVDSSEYTSIDSIVVPPKRLFKRKSTNQTNIFDVIPQIQASSESDKTIKEKTIRVPRKNLFRRPSSNRTQPFFPSNLLYTSQDSINNSKSKISSPVKIQRKTLFTGEQSTENKINFANFINSESEDETPEIQPKSSLVRGSSESEKTLKERALTLKKRNLFRRPSSPRKRFFPSDVLHTSQDSMNSSKSNIMTPVKPPRRPFFSRKPSTEKKINFADFISESEAESPKLQSKIFGSNKKGEEKRPRESMPTMSIDEWKNLASSTMLDNHLPEYNNMTLKDQPVQDIIDVDFYNEVEDRARNRYQFEKENAVQDIIDVNDYNEVEDRARNKNQFEKENRFEVNEMRESSHEDSVKNATATVISKLNDSKERELVLGTKSPKISNIINKSDKGVNLNQSATKKQKDKIDASHLIQNKGSIIQAEKHKDINQLDNQNIISLEEENNDSAVANNIFTDATEHYKDSEKGDISAQGNQNNTSEVPNEKNPRNQDQQAALFEIKKELSTELNQNNTNETEKTKQNISDNSAMDQNITTENQEESQIEDAIMDVSQNEQTVNDNESEVMESEDDLAVDEEQEIEKIDKDASIENILINGNGNDKNEINGNKQNDKSCLDEREVYENKENKQIENNDVSKNQSKIMESEDGIVVDEKQAIEEINGDGSIENELINESGNDENEIDEIEQNYKRCINGSEINDNKEQIDKSGVSEKEMDDSNENEMCQNESDEINENYANEIDYIHESDINEKDENEQVDESDDDENAQASAMALVYEDDLVEVNEQSDKSHNTDDDETAIHSGSATELAMQRCGSSKVECYSPRISSDGSEWDSHRATRNTLRQTFGRKMSRKSIHAFVLENEARRKTDHANATVRKPLANSTEFLDTNSVNHEAHESFQKMSEVQRFEIDAYLEKLTNHIIESGKELDERVKKRLEPPPRHPLADAFFRVPDSFFKRGKRESNKKAAAKPKSRKFEPTFLASQELPEEVLQDMKYKPPPRYKPPNASWATKRLYKFLEEKLEPKYDYKARIRAERLVKTIYEFTKLTRRNDVAPLQAVDDLKTEMARLGIVKTHFDFSNFMWDYMPREIRIKVNPDIVNKIQKPKNGIYSDILDPKT